MDSLSQFLSMLQVGFRHNTNFEALQSYLSLFLKIHAPVISQEGKFKASLEELSVLQDHKWSSLHDELDESLCLVKFFKSSFLN